MTTITQVLQQINKIIIKTLVSSQETRVSSTMVKATFTIVLNIVRKVLLAYFLLKKTLSVTADHNALTRIYSNLQGLRISEIGDGRYQILLDKESDIKRILKGPLIWEDN